MAKGAMMRALARVLERAFGEVGSGEPAERWSGEAGQLGRRGFIKASSAAYLGAPLLMASACTTSAARPDERPVEPEPTLKPTLAPARVAIVGAGMAGLHCAYRLKLGGERAEVFEASSRVGGRMYSLRGHFAEGQVAELGGELIDSDHVTMRSLADELGIKLDDLFEGEPAGYHRDTYFYGGARVEEARIIKEFVPVAALLKRDHDAAEGDDAAFARLDEMSISEWLTAAKVSPLIKKIIETSYTGEYGLEPGEQSALNLIYLIDFNTASSFKVYGSSDERYHTHLGNDLFITKLYERLDEGQVRLGHRLMRVEEREDGRVLLVFEVSGARVERVFDQVVFALPFTTLREVDLEGARLPAEKLKVIRELGYGKNAKLMMGFREKVWRSKHNASGSTSTDNGAQTLWDTARGQDGSAGLMTNFVGGALGEAMGQGTAEERAALVLPQIEQIYPGAAAAYVPGLAARMHWPTAPYARGSYGCYRPGQWSMNGQEGKRVRAMHFCGEHCSEDFQGYMEGAAETGAAVAALLLKELGRDPAVGMLRVTYAKLNALPSACYHGEERSSLRYSVRRRVRRELYA